MSFPKAPLKRFNEHTGCAPAPGSYDIKIPDYLKGPVSFEKSQRFKKMKEGDGGGIQQGESEKAMSPPGCFRKHQSLGSTPNLHHKGEKDSDYHKEMKKQKMLEKEIRSLVKERGDQDKKLQALGEEFKKTEAKLFAAVREKTSLSANVASLERQLADLNKANELLKTKFSDGTKKRINSLCTELMESKNIMDTRDKEFSYLQFNLEGQIKVLQTDLEASKATLTAVQERNTFLEEVHQEANLHSEDLETEMDKLHALVEELREEKNALQGHLADAQDQIKNLCDHLSTREKEDENELQLARSRLEEQTQSLTAKVEEMETQLQVAKKNLEHSLEEVTQLKEKLIVADHEKDSLMIEKAEAEKKLLEYTAEIGKVSAQVEKYKLVLEQSEEVLKQKDSEISTLKEGFKEEREELSKQIKELDACLLSLEQEKENCITEEQLKEQNLNAQLEQLRGKLNQEEQNLILLQQTKDTLLSLLKEEEAVSDSLRQELCHVQEEMLKERGLLEEELEGALDELDRLQLKEEETEKFIAGLEEKNKLHNVKLALLEAKLKGRAELERVNEMSSKEIAQLKEAQSSTLRELEATTAALESYKVSVTGEMESLKMEKSLLLQKVREADKTVQDTQQRLQEMRRSKDKAIEDYARDLEDAQAKLAVKETEMKISLESHLVKTTEFQNRIDQQSEDIMKHLEQLENLRKETANDKRIIELKEEACTWRTLYEDLLNKVKPFQQQLDAFEVEKNALLNEHGIAQEEMNKLSDAYAKLLSHQNQKQKIKHVMKLKEENTQLKQEASRLRSQLAIERQAGKRLQEQLNIVQGVHRFDPSKAFQHPSKENMVPKTPLKDGNKNK
ncbi:hyaluronan mediated motility receptor isoform X2 [Rhinatrema bivittatum]|uniref:hyaluronan mediated motility receptor isoform X2 n=1 Tax=Rhinatrema bivittatum TaxID=194408 RepID=UPI001126DF0F|nr:hyaluronan mediated motility receptor isoform X2 [Rhinatrema bivittatum]